ncbi:multidrug transporter EmrE-like cation transporter [Catenulispora sp. EB89]|uniref:DMT family transporter n=1 Tax=Catenulispora sp. EB89 TaxID=3156257 RepID=UPI003518EFE2
MAWTYLLIASVFEVAFALGTNATHGFTRLWPSVFTLLAAAGGIFTLSLALRTLDVSVGYTAEGGRVRRDHRRGAGAEAGLTFPVSE